MSKLEQPTMMKTEMEEEMVDLVIEAKDELDPRKFPSKVKFVLQRDHYSSQGRLWHKQGERGDGIVSAFELGNDVPKSALPLK